MLNFQLLEKHCMMPKIKCDGKADPGVRSSHFLCRTKLTEWAELSTLNFEKLMQIVFIAEITTAVRIGLFYRINVKIHD